MTERRRYLSAKEKATVRLRQRNICVCGCGQQLESGVHYDHIIPLSEDGTNDLENFQALKPRHHIVKSRKETTRRAKVKRIQAQDGLRKPKRSRQQQFLERLAERKSQ